MCIFSPYVGLLAISCGNLKDPFLVSRELATVPSTPPRSLCHFGPQKIFPLVQFSLYYVCCLQHNSCVLAKVPTLH